MSSVPNPANGFLLDTTLYRKIADHVPPDQPNGALKTVEAIQKEVDGTPERVGGKKRVNGINYVDTLRVIRNFINRPMAWAVRELLQNTFDHSKPGIAHDKTDSVWYPIPGNDNIICIGKDKKACVVIAYDHIMGLMIVQYGLTLNPLTVAGGVQTKSGVTGSAGGFGDGYKSAMEVVLQYGMVGFFEFYNCKKKSNGQAYKTVWSFEKGNTMAPKSAQKHLCVAMKLLRSTDYNTGSTNPIMVTRITSTMASLQHTSMNRMKHAMAEALGSFVLMYTDVSAANSEVYLAHNDRWVKKDKFVPLVPTFGGYEIKPDSNYGYFVFEGIFYESPPEVLGKDAVVFLKGKGLANDPELNAFNPRMDMRSTTVFYGADRNPQTQGVKGRLTEQVARFLSTGETRNACAAELDKIRTVTTDDADSASFIAYNGDRLCVGNDDGRMTIIRNELKRHVLMKRGDPQAETANAAHLEAIPYVSSNDYGEAVYLLSMLSDPPIPAIEIDAERTGSIKESPLYPMKTANDLQLQLKEMDEPFGCTVDEGPYSAIAKFIVGKDTRLFIWSADLRVESTKTIGNTRVTRGIILADPPDETKTGLSSFVGEMADGRNEKDQMGLLMGSFNDATNVMPTNASFVDVVARALRLARGEETLTDEERHRAMANKLTPEQRRAEYERLCVEFNTPPSDPDPDPSDDDNGIDTEHSIAVDRPEPRLRLQPELELEEEEEEEGEEEPHTRRRITNTRRRITNTRRRITNTRLPPRPRPTPPVIERIVRIVPVHDGPGRVEPPVTDHLDQRWNEEAHIYTPDGKAPVFTGNTPMTALAERVELMDKACALIEEMVPGTDMQRVRYTWSPAASWEGLHIGTGVIYVNLALLKQTLAKYLGVLIHEAAHDFGNAHDIVWGRKMQDYFEVLLDKLLERAGQRAADAPEE